MGLSLSSYGKVPEELTRETKNNDEMLESIYSMSNGESCLKSLYKTSLFKQLKANNQGYSLSYAMKTSDYNDYSNDQIHSIEIYLGNSVYSQDCP
jgi:hypothetical protein